MQSPTPNMSHSGGESDPTGMSDESDPNSYNPANSPLSFPAVSW